MSKKLEAARDADRAKLAEAVRAKYASHAAGRSDAKKAGDQIADHILDALEFVGPEQTQVEAEAAKAEVKKLTKRIEELEATAKADDPPPLPPKAHNLKPEK